MSRYTDQERAARVLAESRRILEDRPPPAPAPAPEPRPIVFEDDVAKWKREGTESMQRLEAYRAANRRQVDDPTLAGFATLGARLDDLEQRVAGIEQRLDAVDALANGAAEFSNAVERRLHTLSELGDRFEQTLDSMCELHKREVDSLRTQLTSVASAAASESAFTGRLLTQARREIDALVSQLNRERGEEQTNRKLAHLT